MKLSCFLLISAAILAGCTSGDTHVAPGNRIKRVGMVTGIRPEKIAYYKELHAATWQGVLKKIHEANIRNYTIYLKQIDTAYYLFSHYEYIGTDYQSDMKKIAADSVTQRWWRETAPCQIPLPEAAAKGETWTAMEEVFHTE